MNKKEREDIHTLQGQWLFVVLGALLAVFFGVAINALYDILRNDVHWSPWGILLLFGFFGVAFLDVFSFLFENLESLRAHPSESVFVLLRMYVKKRFRK